MQRHLPETSLRRLLGLIASLVALRYFQWATLTQASPPAQHHARAGWLGVWALNRPGSRSDFSAGATPPPGRRWPRPGSKPAALTTLGPRWCRSQGPLIGTAAAQPMVLSTGVNAGCSPSGRTSTATTLYSGHDVLTSADCPTSRLGRASGK